MYVYNDTIGQVVEIITIDTLEDVIKQFPEGTAFHIPDPPGPREEWRFIRNEDTTVQSGEWIHLSEEDVQLALIDVLYGRFYHVRKRVLSVLDYERHVDASEAIETWRESLRTITDSWIDNAVTVTALNALLHGEDWPSLPEEVNDYDKAEIEGIIREARDA